MGDSQTSATARSLIEEENHEKRISAASHWEIAIKVGLGKLSLSEPFDPLLVVQAMAESMPILSAGPALDAYESARLW